VNVNQADGERSRKKAEDIISGIEVQSQQRSAVKVRTYSTQLLHDAYAPLSCKLLEGSDYFSRSVFSEGQDAGSSRVFTIQVFRIQTIELNIELSKRPFNRSTSGVS
jgi:hypothetical protein